MDSDLTGPGPLTGAGLGLTDGPPDLPIHQLHCDRPTGCFLKKARLGGVGSLHACKEGFYYVCFEHSGISPYSYVQYWAALCLGFLNFGLPVFP